jgi:hypothetical protein
VLRTPALDEDALRLHLACLRITIEVRAIGQQLQKTNDGQNSQLAQAIEILHSQTVKVSEDPMICATEVEVDGEAVPAQFIYIFWKLEVPLGSYHRFWHYLQA